MSKTVLRLCRTFPRRSMPGIGLQPYYVSKYSKLRSVIFTKYINDQPRFSDVKIAGEVKYEDIPFSENRITFLSFLSKIYGDIRMFFYVFTKINKDIKFDFIHTHSIHYLFTSLALKYIYKKPITLSLGGTDLKSLKKLSRFRFLLNKVDCVVYVAKEMEIDIKSIFRNSKTIHISNGVDHDIFKSLDLKREKFFLAIGNYRWQKGYKFLFKAFKDVLDSFPDFQLLIIGNTYNLNPANDITNWESIKNNVLFLGTKNQKEINEYLNKSLAFVMSSVSEGLPKVLIESISTSTPVISSNVGDCELVSRNNGIVVEPGDHKGLSDAMKYLIIDKDAWKVFSTNAKNNSKQYSWIEMAKKLDSIYLDL